VRGRGAGGGVIVQYNNTLSRGSCAAFSRFIPQKEGYFQSLIPRLFSAPSCNPATSRHFTKCYPAKNILLKIEKQKNYSAVKDNKVKVEEYSMVLKTTDENSIGELLRVPGIELIINIHLNL